jgi:hypothetical protein
MASIILLAFFLVACEEQKTVSESVSCIKPYIQAGNDCCLDQDNNAICDVEETVENQSVNEGVSNDSSSEPIRDNPVVIQNESSSHDSSNNPQNIRVEDAGQVNNSLDIFRGKETNIIFGQETDAPLVAATINLLTYFVYPENMKYYTILPTAGLDEFPESNVILLGNGCNNNFIKELLSLDKNNCYSGLENNKGILKMLKVNGNYVLFIMAKEDKDVYYMVNSLVSGQYQTSGNEVEVDLSSLNN